LEVKIDNAWIVVDTDNSPEVFYEFTTKNKPKLEDLFLKWPKYGVVEPSKINHFYSKYSYFNLAKIFAPLGFEVYIHRHIFRPLIYLYESPEILRLFQNLCLIIITLFVFFYALRILTRKNKKQA